MRYFLAFLMVVVNSLTVYAQSERSLIRSGNHSYKENNFTDAEVNYRKALEKSKDLPQGTFNLGDALYKQGRYSEAAQQYSVTSAANKDEATKAQAFHNLGNALLKEKKLPESIAAYKEALKLSPKDMDTKYNLEYAKALLKQQQQQQQKNNQQNNDKQKQDKQKQDQSQQNQQKKEEQNKEQQKQAEQKDQQRQAQQKKQQISKEDAERILEALKNEEKDVQKKLHKRVPARIKVEKDW